MMNELSSRDRWRLVEEIAEYVIEHGGETTRQLGIHFRPQASHRREVRGILYMLERLSVIRSLQVGRAGGRTWVGRELYEQAKKNLEATT